MKTLSRTTLALFAISFLGLAESAYAAPLTITNFSFEQSPGYNSYPGWTVTRVQGTGWTGFGSDNDRTFNTNFSGQTGGNALQLLVNNGAVVGTSPSTTNITTGALGTYAANTTYTFTVSLGADNRASTLAGRISLLGDSSAVAATSSLATSSFNAASTFQDLTLTFTTGSSGGFVGQSIYAQLGTDSSHQYSRAVYFDNVRLDATSAAIPEPSTAALLVGMGALGFGLVRRRCKA